MPASRIQKNLSNALSESTPNKLWNVNKGSKGIAHKNLHEVAAKLQRVKKLSGGKGKINKSVKKNVYADYLRPAQHR